MQSLRVSAGIGAVADGIPPDTQDLTAGSAGSRMAALDGMRGIAAVGVVVFHAYPELGFWMGSFVDLFFVISGFVITRMLIAVPDGHAVSLRNFWMRRILRIWPVYFLTIGAGVAAAILYAWLRAWFQVPDGTWKLFFFVQFTEAYGPHHGGLWEVFGTYPYWLGHSWSIAVEEQFYLFWPLLLVAFRGAWGALGLCLALALACWTANLADWPPLTLATRGLGLAIGSAIAIAEIRTRLFGPGLRHETAAVSGVALGAGLLYMVPRIAAHYSGEASMLAGLPSERVHDLLGFALVYGGLVGWLVACRDGLLARALSGPGLLYLGGVSYGLYMYHVPLLALIRHPSLGGVQWIHDPWMNVAYWSVLLGLAHLSREWIERPFNDRKHAFPLYVPQR